VIERFDIRGDDPVLDDLHLVLPRRACAAQPARIPDRREVPHLERLRPSSRERLHARSVDHERDDVLGEETITSPVGLYWEHQHVTSSQGAREFVGVPTGIARYPREPLHLPPTWVERRYNVVRWVEMPRGGHFAAMEQPDLFVEDVREFFRTARS
jgi:pimeloyl-ACP methyl ester carboxylesterase